MVLLQLAVPKLRQMQSLRDFTKILKREDCDIYAALKAARFPAKHTALLDADKGAGWDLLAGLLRPRSVQVDLSPPPSVYMSCLFDAYQANDPLVCFIAISFMLSWPELEQCIVHLSVLASQL